MQVDDFERFIKIVVIYLDLMLRNSNEAQRNKQFKKILNKFGDFFTQIEKDDTKSEQTGIFLFLNFQSLLRNALCKS